jgi:RNA polymerase sporulation-specific sigma factor
MDPATPLTAAEEQRLAFLVREGDRGARNRMVEANVALVAHIARRLRPPESPVPHVDLVQEGVLGLMQAVERFDPERGHRFSTYASWWIRGSILRALRTAPAAATDGDGVVEELPAEERDPLDGLAREDLQSRLPDLLDALAPHGRRVVAMRYGLDGHRGHSLAETARRLGTSQARVRRIEEHALARLRALPDTQALAA